MKKVIYMGQEIEVDNSTLLIATDKDGRAFGVEELINKEIGEWTFEADYFRVHTFKLPLSFDWTESLRRVDELEVANMSNQGEITTITINNKAKEYKFKSNEIFISYAWIVLQAGFDLNPNPIVNRLSDGKYLQIKADQMSPITNNMFFMVEHDE